ncbi:MAG: hypothetical protein WDZ35_04230 [Crocinitomicaceae bacterium]
MKSRSKKKITVAFNNLSGQEITETFVVKKDKHGQDPFFEGGTIEILINELDKKGPTAVIAGQKKSTPKIMTFILLVALGGTLFGAYKVYLLVLKNTGGDISNTELLTNSPATLIMGCSFLFSMSLIYIIFKSIKILSGRKNIRERKKLKYYGIKAIAEVTAVKETNTKINDRPLIQFDYRFKDQNGREHKGSDRIVMGAVELAGIHTNQQREIIYLPDQTETSKLLANLNDSFMSGCVLLIFLFLSLLFSSIIIGVFVSEILM